MATTSRKLKDTGIQTPSIMSAMPRLHKPGFAFGPHIFTLALLGTLLLTIPAGAADGQVIGVIKTLKGTVSITRNQRAIAAEIGFKLQVNDTIQSGADSSIGMILRDDSVLSMGPNSRLSIDQFLFAPREGRLGFLIKIMRGTVSYVSGLIAKLSPGTARFETPVATIGVRGTRFAVKV